MGSQDTGASIYKRALEITWLAVIFLVPLFFNPQSHQVFAISKNSLLVFLVTAMLAFWIANLILSRAGCKELKWQGILTSPLHLTILAFGLVAILATAASITPSISFWGSWGRKSGLLTLICWILFFLIVAQQLRSRTQLLRAVYTLLLSSGIVSLLGILQYLLPDVMLKVIHSEYPGRVFSTIGNPLFLSSFLAMVIPFNLAVIVYSWGKRKEANNTTILICLVILLALQSWCLWLAQYSITILLYIIAIIIFILLLGIVRRKRLLLSIGAVSLLALIITAGWLMAPLLLPSTDAKAPKTSSSEMSLNAEELDLKTLDWRIQYWRSTIDIVIKSPEVPSSNDRLHDFRRLIGYGPETFIVTFQLLFPEELKTEYTYRSELVDHPHNHYLYLAATIGLLGLMSLLSILAVFFYLCFRYLARARTDIYKLLLIAMVAGMVQYMADIFFNPSTISPELVFWLTLSFIPVVGRLTMSHEPEQAKAVSLTQPGRSRKSYINKTRLYLSAGCALLLMLVGAGIAIRPLLADMYLQKGLNLQAAGDEHAIYAFDKATEIDPGESAYWHYLGAYSYSVARHATEEPLKEEILTLAANAYNKALKLNPYIAFEYYSLADVYTYWAETGATDKWPTALSLHDKAAQLFPRNAVILNKWSLALIIKGDLDEAQTKLDYAAYIDPGWAETSFLSGLLLAREGENDKAVLKLAVPIHDNPANFDLFIDLCHRLMMYDMVSPLRDSLEIYTQKTPDDWTAHALLGITSLFNNDLDKSLAELNSAMLLVPDNDTGDLFRTILKLSTISPPLKKALPGIAVEWRDKLAQSPNSDTLLPALDRLVDNTK